MVPTPVMKGSAISEARSSREPLITIRVRRPCTIDMIAILKSTIPPNIRNDRKLILKTEVNMNSPEKVKNRFMARDIVAALKRTLMKSFSFRLSRTGFR
jgi:hypothetical protein